MAISYAERLKRWVERISNSDDLAADWKAVRSNVRSYYDGIEGRTKKSTYSALSKARKEREAELMSERNQAMQQGFSQSTGRPAWYQGGYGGGAIFGVPVLLIAAGVVAWWFFKRR